MTSCVQEASMAPDRDVPASSEPEPKKVSELWFKDGSIIIQAGLSLYRVSMSVLAARSNVFKDMIESCSIIPRPDSTSLAEGMKIEGKELTDRVPFLKLQDSEADVTHFLKAIFDSGYFEPYPCQTTFSAIVGVLRLSNKYDVAYLRKRALEHLSRAYPTSLQLWETRHERILGYPRASGSGLREAFLVVQLAIEVKAEWLIPSAMYICCTYPIERILDLETQTASFSFAQKLTLCAWAQIRSFYRLLHSHLGPFESCVGGCKHDPRFYIMAADCTKKNDMLAILGAPYWKHFAEGACRNCVKESKVCYQKWRKLLWERLPKMMSLGVEWAELKAMGMKEGMTMCI